MTRSYLFPIKLSDFGFSRKIVVFADLTRYDSDGFDLMKPLAPTGVRSILISSSRTLFGVPGTRDTFTHQSQPEDLSRCLNLQLLLLVSPRLNRGMILCSWPSSMSLPG